MEHLDPDGPITLAPVMVDARADGMVSMAIDDSAVVGTWMDALKLSYTLMSAARSAARTIDVPDSTWRHCLIRAIAQSEMENYEGWD